MTKEVKIGLIGIAALAMLIFGINYLKGINMFQSANYYYVEYTNINGLAGSSPVFAPKEVQENWLQKCWER